jgi:hypothetical protein
MMTGCQIAKLMVKRKRRQRRKVRIKTQLPCSSLDAPPTPKRLPMSLNTKDGETHKSASSSSLSWRLRALLPRFALTFCATPLRGPLSAFFSTLCFGSGVGERSSNCSETSASPSSSLLSLPARARSSASNSLSDMLAMRASDVVMVAGCVSCERALNHA